MRTDASEQLAAAAFCKLKGQRSDDTFDDSFDQLSGISTHIHTNTYANTHIQYAEV